MAKMVNAGTGPLIFPHEPLKPVGLGEEVEVSKETAEIPGVAAWIESGVLVPAKSKAKTKDD